jgi:hypothetical protein
MSTLLEPPGLLVTTQDPKDGQWNLMLIFVETSNLKPKTCSQKKKSQSELTSPLISNPPKNGQDVNLSQKSSIKPTVDHVGLSELLKLLLIDNVSILDKLTKPESLPKICSLVVDHHADLAVEDSPTELGDITLTPESEVVGTTETTNGATHIPSHQVEVLDPKLVPDNVLLNQEEIGKTMLTSVNPVTLSPPEMLKLCNPKS